MENNKIAIYDQAYVDMYDRLVNALSNNDTLYDPANQHWLHDNARMIAELRNVLMDYISYCFESISRIPFSKSNQELFANYAISKAFEAMNCNAPGALEKDIMAITARIHLTLIKYPLNSALVMLLLIYIRMPAMLLI